VPSKEGLLCKEDQSSCWNDSVIPCILPVAPIVRSASAQIESNTSTQTEEPPQESGAVSAGGVCCLFPSSRILLGKALRRAHIAGRRSAFLDNIGHACWRCYSGRQVSVPNLYDNMTSMDNIGEVVCKPKKRCPAEHRKGGG
jgi:hypothetical protein